MRLGYKAHINKAIRILLHTNIDVHIQSLIAEISGDGVKCISSLQSHCANMTFSDKSRYNRLFQQVLHKGMGLSMNFIWRFKNSQALSVSVINSYSEDHFMHIYGIIFAKAEIYCTYSKPPGRVEKIRKFY